MKINAENERVKRDYFDWMTNARGQAEPTVDAAAAALHRFEQHTRLKAFKTFRHEQAVSFKNWLAVQVNDRSGERLSKPTLYGTLKALRQFFEWLSREPGFRSHINFSDAAYFNLAANDVRIAKAQRERPAPSLEQIRHVLSLMPATTAVERRDRAVLAFTALTGARDAATASFQLRHLDTEAGVLEQDARVVKTKRRKTFSTGFFPVGDDVRAIVVDWARELTTEHLFGPDDPLFPATRMGVVSGLFTAVGLDRRPWADAGPIRSIFRAAFERAGLPYFNPHSFRKTIARLGQRVCKTPEEFQAWTQNLGHDKPTTTFVSYGQIPSDQQVEIIGRLGSSEEYGSIEEEQAVAMLRSVFRKKGV